jgi:hypothetical protein
VTAVPLTKPDTFHWEGEGHTIKVAYETFGTGEAVLLLPVFSTVSSREEMRPLAEAVAARSSTGPALATANAAGTAMGRGSITIFLSISRRQSCPGRAAAYALLDGHVGNGLSSKLLWRRT